VAAALQASAQEGAGDDEVLDIPGVGPMSRRQLRNLEAVLNGNDLDPSSGDDLPDLSGLNVRQLEVLEAALATGDLDQFVPSSARARATGGLESSWATAMIPPRTPSTPGSQRQLEASEPDLVLDGSASFLQRPGSSETRGETRGEGTGPQKQWQVDEAALSACKVDSAALAGEHECSICCQEVEADAIALPCRKRGCRSVFHGICIRPWLERRPSCPLCRAEFEELVSPMPEPSSVGVDCPLFELWLLGLVSEISFQQAPMVLGRGRPGRREAGLQGLHGLVMPAHALARLLREHGATMPPSRPETPTNGMPVGRAVQTRPQSLARVDAARAARSSVGRMRRPDSSGSSTQEGLWSLPRARTRPVPTTPMEAAAWLEAAGTPPRSAGGSPVAPGNMPASAADVSGGMATGQAVRSQQRQQQTQQRRELAAALGGRSASMPQLP